MVRLPFVWRNLHRNSPVGKSTNYCFCGFVSCGTWSCVTGWVVHDVSKKKISAFVFNEGHGNKRKTDSTVCSQQSANVSVIRRPRMSVCDVISEAKPFCQIFVRFGVGVLYKKLLIKLCRAYDTHTDTRHAATWPSLNNKVHHWLF